MANTGSDINAPSEEKDVAVNGENVSDDDEMEHNMMDVAEGVSDDNQHEKDDENVNGDGDMNHIMDDILNHAANDDEAHAEMIREYGKALFFELDTVDTILPPIDDTLEKLAQMRKILLEKGISEHTETCLETMVRIVMTDSVEFYRSNDRDCFKSYYVLYFEDLENLWAEIMNNMSDSFRRDKLALTASVTAFERRLSDNNVVGASILKKLPNLLTTLVNDDMESFKWSLDELNAEIIVLYVILSSYFQMVKKLKDLMRTEKKIMYGMI